METEFDSASQVGPGWKSNQAGMPGAVPGSIMDLDPYEGDLTDHADKMDEDIAEDEDIEEQDDDDTCSKIYEEWVIEELNQFQQGAIQNLKVGLVDKNNFSSGTWYLNRWLPTPKPSPKINWLGIV